MRKIILLFLAVTLTFVGCTKETDITEEPGAALEEAVEAAGDDQEGTDTEAEPTSNVESIKIVRLDGKEMEFTDRPIPLRFGIEAKFVEPVSEGTRAQMEESFSLADKDDDAVEFEVEWKDEGESALFKLGENLKHSTEYMMKLADIETGFSTMVNGDVDGDGISDIVIGNRIYGNHRGHLILISGATIGSPQVKYIFKEGESEGDHFGNSVAIVGDMNADGYADVLAGAPNVTDHPLEFIQGSVYAYAGPKLDEVILKRIGGHSGMQLGYTVAAIGDINGDGYMDIMASAPRYDVDNRLSEAGQVSVISGADGADLATFEGTIPKQGMGLYLDGAGDITGDGVPDIAIFSQMPDRCNSLQIFSGADLDGDPIFVKNVWAGEEWYRSLTALGDVNADGKGDVALSTPRFTTPLLKERGKIEVLSGMDLHGKVISTAYGTLENEDFGMSVAVIADSNKDGIRDIVVGARKFGDKQGLHRGKIFILSGADAMKEISSKRGAEPSGYFGARVAAAGDLNEDGLDEIVAIATRPTMATVQILNGADLDEVLFEQKYSNVDMISFTVDGRSLAEPF